MSTDNFQCPKCNEHNIRSATECRYCGFVFNSDVTNKHSMHSVSETEDEEKKREDKINKFIDKSTDKIASASVYLKSREIIPPDDAPLVTIIMNVLAVLGILGGCYVCIILWPGYPGHDKQWKFIAYIPALAWLFAGIIEAALFWAIGLGMMYLKGIHENIKRLVR